MKLINNSLAIPALALWAAATLTILPASGQMDGPPLVPPYPVATRAFYPLETPPWAEERGTPAKAATNVTIAPSWDYDGTALSIDTNAPAAYVQEVLFQRSRTNMTFDAGSFSIMFQPNWSSTTAGGTGPSATSWAAVLSVGNWTSNSAESAWSLALSPAGTNLVMETQSNGMNQVVFDVPVNFTAGDWHQIVVSYTLTNVCMFLDSQILTNAGPIQYLPTYEDCLNYGLILGNLSTSGDAQCHGQLQWLATYDYPLSADEVAADYAAVSGYITFFGGSLPGGGFTANDGPPAPIFTTNGNWGGGGASPQTPPNFGTNLCLLIAQVSNTVVVTFSNTVPGENYLLLAATNVNGPWFTNQSVLASTTVTAALPVSISDDALFFVGVQAPSLRGILKWRLYLGGDGDQLVATGMDASPAIAADGTIYIQTACNQASTSNFLYAIDPLSGQVKWSNNILAYDDASRNPNGCEISSSPAIGRDGTVYAGSEDGRLYAFGSSGMPSGFVDVGVSIYSSPAIASNGTLYFGTDAGVTLSNAGFWAISNNTVKWFFEPQDPFHGFKGFIDSSPAIGADGSLYFLAEGYRLYAVSASGNLEWFLPVPGNAEPDASPSIGPDGTIYVGSDSPYVYAVNPDGSLKWIFDWGAQYPGSGVFFQSSPAVGADGTIYIGVIADGSSTGSLYALNPDGSQKWLFTNSTSDAFSSPAIGADGTVYFGSEDNNIYGVSSNGSLVWFNATGGPIYSSPAIGADGTVYVGSGDGYLYAFFGSTPLATNAPWPMFHKNPAHTGQQSPTTTPAQDCGAPFIYGGTYDGIGDFSFSSVAGTSNAWNVYASSDLVHWTNVYTNLAFDQSVDGVNWNASFMDTTVSDIPQRFYQLSNSTCRSRTIGFVNLNIATGTNLIADQLCQVDDLALLYAPLFVPMNTLNDLFSPYWGNDQLGTEVMKWNGAGFDVFSYGYNQRYGEVIWSDINDLENGDATLLPGIGVFMNNATTAPFTNTFIGLIRDQQVFQIQPGTNYLSSTLPRVGLITNITGYVPNDGDIIQLWNTTNHFQSYTNHSSGWVPRSPSVGVGEGFVLITTTSNAWTNTWQH